MDRERFNIIKRWVDGFIREAIEKAPDRDVKENLELKAGHTLMVEENILRISEALCLEEEETLLARTIALLHDLGRFPQYLEYRTFRDADSVNHGALSAEIVENSGIMGHLPASERQTVIKSIRFHNAFSMPHEYAVIGKGLFLKLIRDADKLDIWRVFSEYFKAGSKSSGAVLGLPDSEGVSEEVLKAIREKRNAYLKDIKNQNDFRLLQLSWVFDLNFRESFRILKERDYFSVIGDIRDCTEVTYLLEEIREYIEKRAGSKVYFAGAGPGDPELLTLKARRLLEHADLIIHAGSLVNPEILKGLKAELYDSSGMALDDIIDLMRQAYNEARLTVRLHSGDPSIYSAINEQIERLRRLNIEFEVIPGVSSFQAGAAIMAQELTVPEISQTVILTRLEGRTPVPEKERLGELARHNATMVIFLSAGLIDRVQEELLNAYPEETPFAVVEKATWQEQRIFRGRLKDLAETIKKAGIKKTALIYIGDVLEASEKRPGRESRLYHRDFRHEYRK
jgi:precorrin-4/cobalt-precorrin-4 C11-methyltransferase